MIEGNNGIIRTWVLVGQAWIYFWNALSENYAAGRYVFGNQPDIKELFYIDYRQELSKKRSPAENSETPLQLAETIN